MSVASSEEVEKKNRRNIEAPLIMEIDHRFQG